MTRGDLIRHCGLELGLDRTASSEEQLLMIDWANEGVRDVLIETRCRLEIGDQALTPGVGDYRVDADVLAVDERTIEIATTKLQIVGFEDIYDLRRSSGIVTNPDVTRIAVEGDMMMVWPTPSSAVTIRYVFVMLPTELAADGNDLGDSTYGGLPIYAHHAVLQYMLWRGSRYEGSRGSAHTPDEYHQFYKDELKRIRKRARRLGGRRMPGMTAGYPGGSNVGSREDIYPSN